jgi:putative redox protein
VVGAPAAPGHVQRHFGDARGLIEKSGQAEVNVGGRGLRIKKQFLEDVEGVDLADALQNLDRALLVLHAPTDDVVGIENASRIYRAARHPKSFIALDGADHLLADPRDACYAGALIAAWAERYINPSPGEAEA